MDNRLPSTMKNFSELRTKIDKIFSTKIRQDWIGQIAPINRDSVTVVPGDDS
jgi:hypothetical protein